MVWLREVTRSGPFLGKKETQKQRRPALPSCWMCGPSRCHQWGPAAASVSLRGCWAGGRAASGRGHYNLVDVSLFMPLRWARLEDSTGSSRGA